MSRLILRSGAVGDYDGAYDWVRKEDYDNPDYTPGYHKSESGWPEDAYTIVETVKAAEVEKLREVASKVGVFLMAGVENMNEAWVPGAVSNQYEALVDAWLALPSELRDALGKRAEEGE